MNNELAVSNELQPTAQAPSETQQWVVSLKDAYCKQ